MKGIEAIREGAKKVKDKGIVLAKRYVSTTRKSIRHELLNLIMGAGLVALIVGALVGSFAKGMGIGRYNHMNYDTSKEQAQYIISQVARELNNLDFMDITYEMDSETVRQFLTQQLGERRYLPEETETVTDEAIEPEKTTTESDTTTKVHEEEAVDIPETTTEEDGETPLTLLEAEDLVNLLEDETEEEAIEDTQVETSLDAYDVETTLIQDFGAMLDGGMIGYVNGNRYHFQNSKEALGLTMDIDESLGTLYTELVTMLRKGIWNDAVVTQKIEAYYRTYRPQNLVKDAAVLDALERLGALNRYAQDHETFLLDSSGNVLNAS